MFPDGASTEDIAGMYCEVLDRMDTRIDEDASLRSNKTPVFDDVAGSQSCVLLLVNARVSVPVCVCVYICTQSCDILSHYSPCVSAYAKYECV